MWITGSIYSLSSLSNHPPPLINCSFCGAPLLFLSVCRCVRRLVTVFSCGHRRPRQTLAQYQLTLLAPNPQSHPPHTYVICMCMSVLDAGHRARAVGSSEDTLCWPPTRLLAISLSISPFVNTNLKQKLCPKMQKSFVDECSPFFSVVCVCHVCDIRWGEVWVFAVCNKC